jgi:hypothetical protein
MFVKFQASSINLALVIHASVLKDDFEWKFQIQFTEDKELVWDKLTRAKADKYLADWVALVCPPPVDFLTK